MHRTTKRTRVRRLLGAGATLAAAAVVTAAPASAHGDPTCAGIGGIENHGQHVVGDYVTGLGGIFGDGLAWPPAGQVGAAVKAAGGAVAPGAPAAHGHFTVPGLAPGASFCNEQAHPGGFTTPKRFAP